MPAFLVQTIDGIKIHSYETHDKYPYDSTRYLVSELGRVGFSEVMRDTDPNPYAENSSDDSEDGEDENE